MPKIDVGDALIHVEERGEGLPLILIHGLGTHSGLWRFQMDEFASRYRIVAVDLRGFGRSTKPLESGSYSVEIFARDVVEVMRQMNLGGAHVLGTSMGGFVAQLLGLDSSELVRSLLLCHTAPRMSMPVDILASRLASLESTSMQDYGTLVATQALSPNPDRTVHEWLAHMIGSNDKAAYRLVLTEGLQHFDVRARLDKIAVPTLVIVGESDEVIPPETGHELADQIPGAEIFTLPGVGHIGYSERPELFNATILDFLGRLDD